MRDILDMDGWTLTDKRTDGSVETFSAEYLHEPNACTKCGSVSMYRHGTKKTTYADSPLRGFAAKLEATVRRYRCRDCGETFLQPLGGVLDERRMTIRCAEFIAKQALRHTFVHVAREVGIDEKTVRAVAAERMGELNFQHTPRLPRVLGIDETKIAGEMRLVLTDPDIAAAYRAKEAFYSLFDLPRDEAIKAFDDYSVPASIKPEFRKLLTAMRNWREEILAVFDHPYTNAYTESLNSLTKHIVKAGRGYSFEVLRARILANYGDPVKQPLRIEFLIKDIGNPCENCGLPCRAEDMHLVTLPPVLRGQRAKRALVCGVCEPRFNTEKLIAHRKASTRKTG